MLDSILNKIYERAALCRAFEEEALRRVRSGEITCTYYSSAGQEYIPATVSVWLDERGITDRQIFVPHRCHSHYHCFGGDPRALALELRGDPRGCAGGMGGSASIHWPPANLYGHDGLMGTQVPIAVGACYANRKPTICFLGDAAAEEDYVLAALGWASTQSLPILFVAEDNDLAILTKKRVRRSWNIHEVAKGFGLTADVVSDVPEELWRALDDCKWPLLLNVRTTRKYWHAGAGCDDPNAFDRHLVVSAALEFGFVTDTRFAALDKVAKAWRQDQ